MANTDDEYVTLEQAGTYVIEWGSSTFDIGSAGHINSASGLGAWPVGDALLEQLRGLSQG